MTESITLSAEDARELVYNGVGEAFDGWTVVAIEEGEASRWVQSMRLIVRRDSDGQLFAGHFRKGLTEQQETEPWDGRQTATFQPVERRTRMVEIVEYVTSAPAGRDQTGGAQ